MSLSEETKKKISESRKGTPAHNKGKHEEIKHVYYTDGKVSIRIPESDIPPEGFVRGRLKRRLTQEEKEKFNTSRLQTNIERYGNANYNNTKKQQETNLQKYGTKSIFESDYFKEKAKDTCLSRYGVVNPASSEQVKLKIKETFINNYGVDNISKSDLWRQTVSDTWKNKSEQEFAEIRQKRATTCLEKYGVTSSFAAPEVITKISKTCLEKYGVEFFCMSSKCRSASSNDSVPNKQFASLLEENNISFEREFPLHRKSYDFKVGNNLIEINPTATHNSTWGIFNEVPLASNYHYEKTMLAKSNGFRCINIWDWDDINKIIMLLQPRQKLFARKCSVSEISLKECNIFLNMYHLQGAVKSEVQIGLFYDNNLVSVMTFGKPRYNKKYQYELLRYASCYNIIGGSQKLFKYFVNNYGPSTIISYCDFSKFSGSTYETLGFTFVNVSISKHWYNMKTKKHITDNLLRQRGFDQLLGREYGTFGKGFSNDQLMKDHDFVEVYDAGQATYIWQKDLVEK